LHQYILSDYDLNICFDLDCMFALSLYGFFVLYGVIETLPYRFSWFVRPVRALSHLEVPDTTGM